MRSYSRAGVKRLTEPWEEFVPYPYDDLVPKVGGHYPEYLFEHPPRGTVSIAFGHTDAAGNLKIERGMRLTRQQAEDLLLADMAPCERAVNRLLKVDVTQHQFDMVCDTYFNCPAAAIAAIKLFNAGQAGAVPAKLLQYVSARDKHTGELVRMQGLVNRRNAEVAWGNTPDETEPPPAPNPDVVFAPKAERNDPPKTMAQSKTGTAAISLGGGALAALMREANDVLAKLQEAQGKFASLGISDQVSAIAHSPAALMCAGGIALAAFIYFDRRNRLVNDHV